MRKRTVKLKWHLWLAILFAAITVSVLPAYFQQVLQPRRGVQFSTLGALNMRVYKGATTLAQLKQHGDFGLGTFEELDGETIGLDGKFYQVKTDGVAYRVANGVKTPFSVMTFFYKQRSLHLTGQMTYPDLQHQIDH